MTKWRELSQGSFSAAKAMLGYDTHAHTRSSINRAYYAVYAGLTNALISHRGEDLVKNGNHPNPGHEQLEALVKNNLPPALFPQRTRNDLATRLRNLRRSRIAADYEPEAIVPQIHARMCVRDAAAILERLER